MLYIKNLLTYFISIGKPYKMLNWTRANYAKSMILLISILFSSLAFSENIQELIRIELEELSGYTQVEVLGYATRRSSDNSYTPFSQPVTILNNGDPVTLPLIDTTFLIPREGFGQDLSLRLVFRVTLPGLGGTELFRLLIPQHAAGEQNLGYNINMGHVGNDPDGSYYVRPVLRMISGEPRSVRMNLYQDASFMSQDGAPVLVPYRLRVSSTNIGSSPSDGTFLNAANFDTHP